MRTVTYFAPILVALSLTPAIGAETAVDRAKEDEIVSVPKGDQDMEEAFRQAQQTLKGFLDLAHAPHPTITSMAVKVAVHDNGATEYFWVRPFTERDGHFVGKINNTPRSVHNVKLGQTIAFQQSEIVDWLYRENGKMFGNFTACALLKHVPPSEMEAFEQEYGLNCESI
jgi:uncharacterized protein YegJ (DUF2314 family)